MQTLALILLGINFIVSYLLARRLEKRLVANGSRYSIVISVFAGLIIFSVLVAAIIAMMVYNLRFER
jgi:hypothetical protein